MASGQLFVMRTGTIMTLPSSANNLGLDCKLCAVRVFTILYQFLNAFKCFFTVVVLSVKQKVYTFQR